MKKKNSLLGFVILLQIFAAVQQTPVLLDEFLLRTETIAKIEKA